MMRAELSVIVVNYNGLKYLRGFTYTVVPNSWTNRKYGVSKLKIKEMGQQVLFYISILFCRKIFSRGDFKRQNKL